MGRQSVHRGGSSAISRYLKVLLPSSLSNSGKLRISDELARHWDGGDVGSGGVALLASAPVVPFGMVWRVEVGRDAEGAFLGRGWPEFAAEHGFGTGWFIVLRHEPGGGVLTVKAFDTTCCLREFGRPLIGVTGSSTTAIRFSPRGKFCRVTVDKDHTGNVFFSGGWSRFLASNGIAEYDVLLLRHEGNMVFTVNVFGPDGSQKGCKDQDTSPPSRGKGLHQRGDKTG
nr:unnamed protein product [Digitaria exilis]